MVQSSSSLTLREVAEELGVHYMTAYRYVRLGLLPAVKAGSTWRVDRADLERFTSSQPPTPGRGKAPWAERLEARLLAADQAGAWRVVEAALAAGVTPSRIYTELVGPALRRIGDRWMTGEITVGEEHTATAVANRLIGRLGPRFARRGRSRGTILATTPPGDRHGLGLEMLSDVLRGAGYEVVTLGSDVPADSITYAVRQLDRLVAVCVSVMVLEDESQVRTVIRGIRDHAPGVPILVGGVAVEDEAAARSLGADAWAPDALGAVEVLEELTRG